MKKALLTFVICSLFIGCATKKNKQTTDNIHMEINIPDTLKTSPSFKMFCNDLRKDRIENRDNSSYKPSDKLQKKYSLSERNGIFYVRGYIRVNQVFDRDAFQAIGGASTAYTNEIQSFSIPIDQLPNMVLLPGITYLELAQQVKLLEQQ